MFDNIGGKIKSLATVLTAIGMVVSIILGIVWLVEEKVLGGFLTIGLGCFFSWIASFAMYGYGQLIENSDTMVRQLQQLSVSQKQASIAPSASFTPTQPQASAHQWRCDKCGRMVSQDPCPFCGKKDA